MKTKILLAALLLAVVNTGLAQPTAPTVATLAASSIGPNSATLNAVGNPSDFPTFGFFQWGTTTNYGSATPAQSLGNGGVNVNFSQALGGLMVGATYHFRAVVSNSFHVVSGSNQSLTTPVFTDLGAGLPGVVSGSVAWGDYDNDSDLDILITGLGTNGAPVARVYRNNGNGTFTDAGAGLPGVSSGSVAWGDYDNDGDLDILLTGNTGAANIARIYRNNGNGTFTDIVAGLPGVQLSAVAWGDFDNDGDLDILLTGNPGTDPITRIYRNNGNGNFCDIVAGLPGVSNGSVAWGDYDNDGDLDILLTGFTLSGLVSRVYRNNGNGTFTDMAANLPGVNSSSVAWGDYDNDGDLDILQAGNLGVSAIASVYRNNGNGTFTDIAANLPGVRPSSAAWGDYDNDGKLDILLTGLSTTGRIARVYRNNGNATFTDANVGLPGVELNSAAWGDYDNDGRLDILLVGKMSTLSTNSQVWRNNTPQTNTPPNAPAGLRVTASGGLARFDWNASTDAQTPAAGLNYNLRIGTTPGGSDVLSPAAAPSGFRRVPQVGKVQPGFTAYLSYQRGTPYYWSVQAVDSAFAGSAFAGEGSFRILENPVVVPVTTTNLLAGDFNGDGMVSQFELDTVLTNYFPTSPFLQITNVAGLGGTNVTFSLSNLTGGAFSVEYSTNLSSPSWQFLGPATPRYLFTDTNAPGGSPRYYRLRWP